MSEPQVYEYEGPVTIRPCDRGIVLRAGGLVDARWEPVLYWDDVLEDVLREATHDGDCDTFPRVRIRLEVEAL